MATRHPLTLAICCAFAVAACKEAPPPNDRTALTATPPSAMTTPPPAMTTPIDSTTAPGTPASDATPPPESRPAPGSDSTPVNTTPAATSGTTTTAAPSTAVDSPATNPMAPLSKDAEKVSMPLAGQANNHSSPSLDPKEKQ